MSTDELIEGKALPSDIEARLFEAVQAVMPPENSALRRRILARVRDEPPLVSIRAGEGAWQPFLPRVDMKVLREDGEFLSYLLRLQPGAEFPPHQHPLDEECLVLEGEIRLGDLVLRAGDYHLAPQGVPHGRIVSPGGALLFLRSAGPAVAHLI